MSGAALRAGAPGEPAAGLSGSPTGNEVYVYPASFAQSRLWFLDRLEPGSPAYNVGRAFRLTGVLDRRALKRALTALVDRHETLRTTFADGDEGPVQRIAAARRPALPMIDLSGLRGAARDGVARLLATRDSVRPFDLRRGPLFRSSLLCLEADHHLLLLTVHHIVSDAWSAGVLIRELAALYRAFRRNLPSPLPDLPVQYADYAVWQREWLQGEELDRHVAYWRRRLAGAPPLLPLPCDRPRPAVQTFQGAHLPFRLPPRAGARLRELAARRRATPFMVLLAVYAALLGRWSGSEDVCVGVPVSGRTEAETEGLVGFFVNTLVIRVDLGGDPTFGELVSRIRGTVIEAQDHQDLPFEKLVEALAPERSLSHAPLFQVALNWMEAPRLSAADRELAVRSVAVEHPIAKFDLTLSVTDDGGDLPGHLEHATDLFDGTTAARFLDQLRRLLAHLAERPDDRPTRVSLLSPGQRHQLVREWRDTRSAAGPPVPLIHRLAAYAELEPDAVALVAGRETLSRRELAMRSRALAWALRRRGVGPEVRVGLRLDRSPALLVALLAVLEAGAAWVPLDPGYPIEWSRRALEDARAALLLTRRELLDPLHAPGTPTLLLDRGGRPAEPWAAVEAAALPGDPGPGRLAAVLFTSGSTGRPKGVAIPYGAQEALVRWAEEAFSPRERRRVAATTSICFDLAVFELLVPLCTGGSVVLLADALALAEACAGGVTLVNTVPSAAAELLEGPGLPNTVVTVNLAGEALPRELAERVLAGVPARRLLNLYGPSEDTTYSTWEQVPQGEAGEPRIGRPVGDGGAVVVDGSLRLVPPGVTGELALGGVGLARGYLGLPGPTAERFVPEPWGGSPGARLYRTGDLVRQDADGRLRFLGRADRQVKVRGFRIEPGEVEAVISRLPGVRECAVVPRAHPRGGLLLAAYVAGRGLYGEGLRRALEARLPAHLVPGVFLLLEALPRTPNGKVDRFALPEPGPGPAGSGEGAPFRTVEEELVAAIWARALGLDRVARDDDFFALGGHSLLATRVLYRVRETFGVELPLRSLFQAPTLAAFAAEVGAGRGSGDRVPPLEPVDRGEPLPVSFAQRRLWFLDRLEPGSPAYNMSAGLTLAGSLSPAVLERAVHALARRHETLRTRFEERDGEPVQVVEAASEAGVCLLARIDLGRLPEAARGEEARRASRALAARSLDLSEAPLACWALLRLAPRRHVLLLTVHHAAADGWSLQVLLEDLAELYRAGASGRPPDLPPLAVQYGDFAVWQRRWLSGEALEARLAPWRRSLADLPPALELPSDRPRPPVRTSRGAERPVRWPRELTDRLRRLASDTGTTLFMVALAGFQSLLQRHAGADDFAVGTPVAGRDRAATERVVGCFVNTLVLRARLAGDPTVTELLGRARETLLEAHAHREVPFEALVEALAPARSLAHTPLFQVMCSLWSGRSAAPELPGLVVEPSGGSGAGAKFDLLLGLQDRGDEVVGDLVYATDLFDSTTAERLVRQLAVLLEGFATRPQAALDDLPILSRPETHQLLRELSDTAAPTAPDRCLHEGFADQVARTPERVALRAGGRCLTYAGLDRLARRIATRLSALGAGPEGRVEICLDREPELVAALLGALRAGAAYVPLDPAYPARRLAAIAAESGAGWLVTRRGLHPGPVGGERRVVYVEELGNDLVTAEPGPAPAGVRPENLAYVVFSSGSTGVPKGVAIEHRSAWALVRWARAAFGDEELAETLSSTSVCFDLSVFEIFVPLSTGGTVVLAKSVLDLPSMPDAGRLTLLNTVPSAVAELLELGPLPPSIRTVNLAGEVLEGAVADRVVRHDGLRRLLNLYGPSEDTTYTTTAEVQLERAGEPTLGRPVHDTRIRLLDATLLPVPLGAPGELCISGSGSARGYLGRPAFTAERWVPDPWGERAGGRLYRSGDLARYRTDGELELLGRLDHQVKVRGFRIETGEVEAAVSAHEAVREAAVVAVGDSVSDRRLAAFLVPRDGAGPPAAELRRWLAERLPGFMVPSSFKVLDRLPRTPHGKVDRPSLVALTAGRSTAPAGEPRAPRDSLEAELADLFAGLLRGRPVGVDDDFFELGGHSLLAVRLMAGIRHRFGREVPLSDLFRYPTVEGLAGLLRRSAGPARRSPLVRFREAGIGSPLFLVHPVGGNVLCYRELALHLDPRPVLALESPALRGEEEPAPDLETMAERYLDAVEEARPEGELLLGGWSSGGVVAYEMAQRAVRRGRRVGPLLLIDSFVPADVPDHDEGEIVLLHAWRLGLDPADLEARSPEGRLGVLVAELRRRGLLVGEGDAREVRRLLHAYRSNLGAVVTYRPRPYRGEIVLFRSTDPEDYRDYAGLFGRGPRDPAPGWGELAAGPFTVRDVPGTHNSLLAEPRVARLAAEVAAALGPDGPAGPSAPPARAAAPTGAGVEAR